MTKSSPSIRFWLVFLLTCVVTVCGMYVSLTNGSFDIPISDVFQTLFRVHSVSEYDLVIFEFRLPRIVIGAVVGFGLGVAGAVLQGITKNELADPSILGIHAAAGTAIVLYMFFFQGTIKGASWFSVMTMPLFGWLGGLAAVMLLYLFARHRGTIDPQRLILVGIALGSGFGAITLFISLKMNPNDFEMAVVWLAGSIYSASWLHVKTALPWVIILVPIIWSKAKMLDLLQLHEMSATGLGINTERERGVLLICCVGLVSACVSVAGSIGFVGLIAPHIARRLVGIHYRFVVPACGAIGMAMVVIGDFIGKTIFAPAELPVGIVISIIGVPYFIYLLYRARKK